MKIAKISANVPTKAAKSSEAALKKILDVLVAAQQQIVDLLASVEKTEPLAPASAGEVKKQKKITETGRSAAFKDLAKSAKRGELHTNPAKLKALIKSLNEDIAAANNIEGSVPGHLDTYFQGQIDDIEDEITRALPKGVTPALIYLDGTIVRFKRKQSKQGWKKFSVGRRNLISDCRDQGEEQDRKNKISALGRDREFLKIKIKVREKIIKEALANPGTKVSAVKVLLEAAFETQDKPSLDRWRTYLKLGADGSYRVTACGAFLGNKVHWTMSSESWTANADGRVSIKDNSVDQILSAILESTDWKQLHTTLEVTKNTKVWPHVFLFAGVLNNDRKWANAKTILKVDNRWVTAAQAKMTGDLNKILSDLKKKVKLAKAQHGANV